MKIPDMEKIKEEYAASMTADTLAKLAVDAMELVQDFLPEGYVTDKGVKPTPLEAFGFARLACLLYLESLTSMVRTMPPDSFDHWLNTGEFAPTKMQPLTADANGDPVWSDKS